MTEIKIDMPENRKICINGEVFEVLLNDFEVLELAEALSCDLAGLSDLEAADVISGLKKAVYSLDTLLGDGAVKRLLEGRAVSVGFMLDGVLTPVISEILRASGEAYADKISHKYGVCGSLSQ